MASVNGFFVEPMCAGYCATKGAIIALTKAMAIDHGKRESRQLYLPRLHRYRLGRGYFEVQSDPLRPAPLPASCMPCTGSAGRRKWRAWLCFWPPRSLLHDRFICSCGWWLGSASPGRLTKTECEIRDFLNAGHTVMDEPLTPTASRTWAPSRPADEDAGGEHLSPKGRGM